MKFWKNKVHFMVKEFDILCLLVVNKGQVVTYKYIKEYGMNIPIAK